MSKQVFLPVLLMVLLQASAFGQDTKSPNPPGYCKPCLFYGGDFSNSATAAGIANEEDILVKKSEVLVPFDVPTAQQWEAVGLFTNDFSSVSLIDPAKAAWSISTGVTQGSCGTPLTSGNSRATFKPTGRSAFGLNEYTTLVKIKGVQLPPGRYWLATVPECTNTANCTSARYFASDFVGKPLDPFGPPEPCNQSYWTSKTFGENCTRITGKGCNRFSAGVLGTKQAADSLLETESDH
jgi:hypothetical protein